MSKVTDNTSEQIDIILPKEGLLYNRTSLNYILCKPKLMPLKSVTLEKLEKMQKDAEQKMNESKIVEEEYNEHK